MTYVREIFFDSYKLHNGVQIPCVGFGTWQTPNGEVAVASVKKALEEQYKAGRIRSIGISNFHQRQIDELMKTAPVAPW